MAGCRLHVAHGSLQLPLPLLYSVGGLGEVDRAPCTARKACMIGAGNHALPTLPT